MTKEYHEILAEASGGRYTPEEVRDLEQGLAAHNDAAAEQHEFEQEQKEADEKGVCVYCYEPKDQCSGYKCWIR